MCFFQSPKLQQERVSTDKDGGSGYKVERLVFWLKGGYIYKKNGRKVGEINTSIPTRRRRRSICYANLFIIANPEC